MMEHGACAARRQVCEVEVNRVSDERTSFRVRLMDSGRRNA